MAHLSPVLFAVLLAVCLLVGLLIGYLIGTRSGGGSREALDDARREHDSFKSDVREHFEETAQIMSRMVHDYRDMYQHMAEGAERLAELNREKMVSPPPAPEAITEGTRDAADSSGATASSKPRDDRHKDDDNQGVTAGSSASEKTAAASAVGKSSGASPRDEETGSGDAKGEGAAASHQPRVDRHADDDAQGTPVTDPGGEAGKDKDAAAKPAKTADTEGSEATGDRAPASGDDKRAT